MTTPNPAPDPPCAPEIECETRLYAVRRRFLVSNHRAAAGPALVRPRTANSTSRSGDQPPCRTLTRYRPLATTPSAGASWCQPPGHAGPTRGGRWCALNAHQVRPLATKRRAGAGRVPFRRCPLRACSLPLHRCQRRPPSTTLPFGIGHGPRPRDRDISHVSATPPPVRAARAASLSHFPCARYPSTGAVGSD